MAIKTRTRKCDGITFYVIDFRDQDGDRIRETAGTTRTQAKDLLTRRRGEVKAGTYVNAKKAARRAEEARGPTFAEFADRFLREYAEERRSDYYAQQLRAAVDGASGVKAKPAGPMRRYFDDRRLREVTATDLDQYRAHSLAVDRVGSSTTRKRLTVLGTLFKCARRWGVVDANPAADLAKPAEANHKVRFLSIEEWKRLIAIAPEHRLALYRMAVATGMRLKELTGLRWEDVSLQERLLHVAEDTKTGTRAVPIGAEAKAVLEAQRQRRTAIGREQGKLTPYVFVDAEGEHLHSRERRNRLTKTALADMRGAEISDASFHTFRHTAAAWMVQAGRSLYEVQRILGHSTPLMTQRYAHLEPKHLRDAVDALDAAIRGVDTPVDTNSADDSKKSAAIAASATLARTSVIDGPLAQG